MRFKEVWRGHECGYTPVVDEIYNLEGVHVGDMTVLIYEDGGCYCERIDIIDEYQNRGYGTCALTQLSKDYGFVLVAPDNADAQRLYARLGIDVTEEHNNCYLDQGFGVYEI